MSAPDQRRVTRRAGASERALLDELRALQREDQAPSALRHRVLEGLANEPASAPSSAPRSARSRAGATPRVQGKLQPRSIALGALAAALPFALLQVRSLAPRDSEPEFTLAPEPSEPGSRAAEPSEPHASAAGGAQPERASAEAEKARALASLVAKARAATARKLAAPAPRPAVSSIGQPAPETLPGLKRDLPARGMVVPGFAPTSRAVMSEGPLPPALGSNLVTNGDFSQGTALWSVRRWDDFVAPAPTALAPYDVVQGALCTTLRSGDFVIGGWPWDDRSLSPNSFALERGQRYRVSLRAWVKGSLQVALVFKVGHQELPYDAALVAAVPVTQIPRLFSIAFEPHADDDNAGVGFVANALANAATRLGSSDLCIDDVRLTREARPL